MDMELNNGVMESDTEVIGTKVKCMEMVNLLQEIPIKNKNLKNLTIKKVI